MTENLIGKKYNLLTVVSSFFDLNTGHIICECKCDCGNNKTVRLSDLKRGVVKSCGCLHKKDEINKQYGDKIVVEEIGKTKSGDIKYLCKCIYCKKETKISGADLRRGRHKNCVCRKEERKQTEDKYKYVGKKYNKLEIVSVFKRGYCWFAFCKCDCNKEKEIRLQSILSGKTKSCGCDGSVYGDKTGMRFGELYVERKTKDNNGNIKYIVKCNCGRSKTVSNSVLRIGGSTSCGYCARSRSNINRTYKKNINKKERFIEQKYNQYKKGAEKRGYIFDLSIEQFSSLILDRCYYCGCEGYSSLGEGSKYNGIDRFDNTKGYIENNVVTACKLCNYAKGKLPTNEFFEWVARITYYNVKCYIDNK